MSNTLKFIKRSLDLHHKGKKEKYINAYINKKRIPACEKLYIKSCHAYNTGDFLECIKCLLKLNKVYRKFDKKLYVFCLRSLSKEAENIDDILLETKKICHLFSFKERNDIVKIFNRFDVGSCFESLSNFAKPSNMNHKVVTNCLYDGCSSGIGDFLRGSVFLFEILNPFNIQLELDVSNHVIYNYLKLKSSSNLSVDDIFDHEKASKNSHDYNKSLVNFLTYSFESDNYDINIFTHISDMLYANVVEIDDYTLSKECRSFFQNKIQFTEDIVSYANKNVKYDYDVVHFRCGDYELVQRRNSLGYNNKDYEVDYNKCVEHVKRCQKDKKLLVLSDSNKLKEYVLEKCKDATVLHTKSCHSSINPGNISGVDQDNEKMFYVALDMFLVTKASSVYSYSVYPWGSGFTFWLSKIYNLPIQCKSLINE